MRPPALLLDTNVWLDYELGTERADTIMKLLREAHRHGARIGIAAHSLKDVFTIVERRLKQLNREQMRSVRAHMPEHHTGPAARSVAWGVVEHILQFAEVVGTDYMDAHMAVKDRVFHDYYEDNLVVAAARRMDADLLVTSDVALQKHAPVPTLSPDRAILWLEQW